MKTYKHKKTGEIATYKDGILKSSGFSVEIGVEPSSEFWELVPQKEFEIMSFIANQDIFRERSLSIKNGTIVKRTYEDNFYGCGVNSEEGKLLANSKWSIHSIKRLSDGEVFTVGDKVKHPGYKEGWIIASFEPQGYYFNIKDTDDHWCMDNRCLYIQKIKPVLTTQDGVDIYLGDEYFAVDNGNTRGGVYKFNADGKFLEPSLVRFSTRELAEDYILTNKRCLSVQDVHNIIKNTMHSTVILKELKDIVKSR